jgi:hypothetical protein
MLHEVERHEPITSLHWDERAARACIKEIVDDARRSYSLNGLWPSHTLDSSLASNWNLYVGAAGAIWALSYLASEAVPVELPKFSEILPTLLEPNRVSIRSTNGKDDSIADCGLLMGDTGILLVQARLGGIKDIADQIGALVDANQDNPAREFMWGSPGTMLASLWLHDWTGEEVWADRFRRDAALLWERLEFVPAAECYLWTQSLYGHEAVHIGAVHGFAGNALPLIHGWRLLSFVDKSRWTERLASSLQRTAIWENDCANWPQSIGKHRPGRTAMLVQHCHGAPGIVNCFAEFPDPIIDHLLIAAGEMTWRAGPLRKGAGLCHGTSGNGYAFLKLFRRTGDARWLDRARLFAMHAIEQQERDAKEYAQRRYTLWTGDLGLAIYLWNCINATDRFPTVDTM